MEIKKLRGLVSNIVGMFLITERRNIVSVKSYVQYIGNTVIRGVDGIHNIVNLPNIIKVDL